MLFSKLDLITMSMDLIGDTAAILFTFQAVKKISAHPKYLLFGLFCNVFSDFWVSLGINSFSQRTSKIDGNRKFGRFEVV